MTGLTSSVRDQLEELSSPYNPETGEDVRLPSAVCFQEAEKLLSSLPEKCQDEADLYISFDSESIVIAWYTESGDIHLYITESGGEARVSYDVSLEGNMNFPPIFLASLITIAWE